MTSLTSLIPRKEGISIGKYLKKCDLDMKGDDSTLHKREIKAEQKADGMQLSIPFFLLAVKNDTLPRSSK